MFGNLIGFFFVVCVSENESYQIWCIKNHEKITLKWVESVYKKLCVLLLIYVLKQFSFFVDFFFRLQCLFFPYNKLNVYI